MALACAVLGFPVSSYYFAKQREAMPAARETRDAMLKDKITEVWKTTGRELYGARKMWLELNQQGVEVARCTVERLMRDLGLSGVTAQTFRSLAGWRVFVLTFGGVAGRVQVLRVG